MIRQHFNVESYWEVVAYYNVGYNLFHVISRELKSAGASADTIRDIHYNMSSGNAKAVTFSNMQEHKSVVLFNKHYSYKDYISSIVHEAEHIKQAMLRAYKVNDSGEPPAYTVGYLVKRMYEVFITLSYS